MIEFIATTLLGVESITARECQDLGFDNIKVEDGKVCFMGDLETLCQANIWLRTAERIYIKVGEFTATTFEQLFENTKKLEWEKWIPENAEFPVNAYSLKSALHSVPDCQAIVKKAIVERLKKKYKKEWFDEQGPKYKIQLGLLKDKATLMIDTSGQGLHKRGYRQNSNEAPLKETLAASIILLSFWKDTKTFVDPFCGSGTFPIEAALIGANIAPGLNREFVSETWNNIPKDLWTKTRKHAHSLIKNDICLDIIGSDIDKEAIKLSRKNAGIAGVSDWIKFYNKDVKDFMPESDYGVLICNPPYGERMGELKQIEKLYKQMGQIFSKYPTWSYYVLTSYSDFENLYGKKANKKRKLYNGMLKCDLYQFWGDKPPKQ